MASIGDTIAGRYELRDLLGACATRRAYRAFDTEVEVEVALWVLEPSLFPTPDSRASFVAAAGRARGLRHRHLLRIFEAGPIAGQGGESASIFMTQQLGTSAELEGRLSTGGESESGVILRYARALSSALGALHREGLYHGWLTPADVVEVAGQVKLCGAGLFATMDVQAALARFGGHRRYLAPELLASGQCGTASDWYSLGVILLELATGRPAESVVDSLAALTEAAPNHAEALRLVLVEDPVERPAAASSFMAAMQRGWDDPLAETGDYPRAINPVEVEPEANFAPTIAMGQNYIDAAVADAIAAHRAATGELMVSEVVERTEPSVAGPPVHYRQESEAETQPKNPRAGETLADAVSSGQVATPPGGFEEGETRAIGAATSGDVEDGATTATINKPAGGVYEAAVPAVVDHPSGGFEGDATVAISGPPPGGFEEGATVAINSPPPGGFEEGATVAISSPPPGGFDEGPTVHRAIEPEHGFDDGVTMHRPAEPPGGFDEGATQHQMSIHKGAFDDGNTVDSLTMPTSGFDDGHTVDPVPTPTDAFVEELTAEAAPALSEFSEDGATIGGEMDLHEDSDEFVTISEDSMPPAGGFDEGATVIDAAPGVRLLALSMKPKPDPGIVREVKRKPYAGLPAKPVIRPLSSLVEPVEAPPDLGKLAPPRAEPLPPPKSPRKLWLALSLVLVAGAATVTLILMLSGSEVETTIDASVAPVAPEVPTAPSKPREVVVIGPGCAEGAVHLPELNLCVDAYESPGKGRQPQSGITLAEAQDVCGARKMRLCTGQEWESACHGGARYRWPYGNHYKAEICNLRGDSVEVAGARNECRSAFAIFDMSGNIAEWVAEGDIRGGSALDRSRGQCSQKRANPDQQSAFSDVGFRCCADAIASPPPSD